MYVLHHDLEAIEATCFRNLNLTAESLDKVFVDDSVRGSKEGKDVRDKEAFVIVQFVVPVVEIFGEVDFFGSPEGSFSFLICLPDLMVPKSMLAKGIRVK